MTLGRNDQCPCGSGRKAKRCHEDWIGLDPRALQARSKTEAWEAETQTFLAECAGYVAPLDATARTAWRQFGCPFTLENGEPVCKGDGETVDGSANWFANENGPARGRCCAAVDCGI